MLNSSVPKVDRHRLGTTIAAAAIAVVALAGVARAGEGKDAGPRAFVHFGAAGLFYNPSTTVRSGGADVPGADAHIGPNYIAALEVGVFPFSGFGLLDNVAVSVTVGSPPTATIEGAGSIAAAGTLGKATYGPAVLSAHYHFRSLPIVQPYLGVGLTYAIIFGTDDGSMSALSVDPAFGFVAQAGFDVSLGERWGLFADVKQVLLTTDASGSFGGMPTSAELTVNPTVVTLGGTIRF